MAGAKRGDMVSVVISSAADQYGLFGPSGVVSDDSGTVTIRVQNTTNGTLPGTGATTNVRYKVERYTAFPANT